jgi:hypothetical protein
MLDTEASAQYQAPRILKETGLGLVGVQTRALGQAVEFLRTCMEQQVSVAIIDSVTHLWRECCDSYLKQKNDALAKLGKNPRTRLSFEDWQPVKAKWGEFADLYLTLPLHVIICGRAGFEYDYEENEDGKKELIKTGIKMKTEGEFGFEPSLLIEMKRIQVPSVSGAAITHEATVIGDRFGILDGKTANNPDASFFKPYLDALKVGSHASVDITSQTSMGVDEAGNAEWQAEKKARAILSEEIAGELLRAFPGQSAAEKKAKADLCQVIFGTTSWTAIENMKSVDLRSGKEAMVKMIADRPAAVEEEKEAKPKKKSA